MTPQEFLNQYYAAFVRKDWPAFSSMIDDSFLYITDRANTQDKQQFVDFLKKDPWVGEAFSVARFIEHTSSDGTLATCAYDITFQGTLRGETFNVHAWETMVLRRSGKDFVLLHCQVSNA